MTHAHLPLKNCDLPCHYVKNPERDGYPLVIQHNCGKSPCLMGKSTTSMVMFSYFDITRAYQSVEHDRSKWRSPQKTYQHQSSLIFLGVCGPLSLNLGRLRQWFTNPKHRILGEIMDFLHLWLTSMMLVYPTFYPDGYWLCKLCNI